MKTHEIEGWALTVIEQVRAGQPCEDSRVELKAQWPDDIKKTARQIAGHANAALGVPILWLIGLDENKRCVVGAAHNEFSRWHAQVNALFDECAPAVTDLNVKVRRKVVVALAFETDRAPYVIKHSEGGRIDREIPWREGTAVRTARRADLLRLIFALREGTDLRRKFETFLDRWEREWNGQQVVDHTDWGKAQRILQEHYSKLLDLDCEFRRLLEPAKAQEMERVFRDLQELIRDIKRGGAFGDELPQNSWKTGQMIIAAIHKIIR